jgi:hypothetical protein
MNIYENFIASAVAGLLGSIVTHPIDVIKTNFMVSKSNISITYGQICEQIYRESGIMGFSRGIVFRTIHMSIMSIILLCGYEQILNMGLENTLPR